MHSLFLSSALSQPGDISASTSADPEILTCEHQGANSEQDGTAHDITATLGTGSLGNSSANDMLCTSQTLDDEPLTPEVVAPPTAILTSRLVYMLVSGGVLFPLSWRKILLHRHSIILLR